MKQVILLSILLVANSLGFAQLTTVVQDPVSLVQNVLLGDPNINVSNIVFHGATNAIGRFNATGTNLGINSGIVMTTGTIIGNQDGPIGPNNSASAGIDNGTPGYQLLTNIVGRQTYNASVLEFDFQTCSDSIEFRYVFASEEYPEYVGSEFNDVFGFFISGPGFSGQQNIARLPNGNVVAINNVNNGNTNPAQGVPVTGPSNPQYFVPNGNGNQAPFNQSNIYIQYDGFTKVLTAKVKIQCNAVYHLVLAIADVGDGVWDSGMFLEAQSFKSNDPLKITYSLDNQAFPEPNVLVEPCATATVRLTRTNCNTGSPMTINIATSGSATNGVDYQTVPSSVTIPAGALYTEFNLVSLFDNLPEGTENVVFTFTYLDNCGEPQTQELELFIRDMESLQLELDAGEIICPGSSVEITSQVFGGGPPYVYTWSTGETTPSIEVTPTETTTYTLAVTDECTQQVITKSITIVVPPFVPLTLDGTDNIVEMCPYIPATLEVEATGGFGGYSYQWSNANNGQTLGNTNTELVTPSETTTYHVLVTDACGLTETYQITYTILSAKLEVELNPDIEICPGDSIQLFANVTGGFGQYYYSWPHSGESTSSVWVHPTTTTNYMVVVSDECQTFSVADIVRVIVVKPTADFNMVSTVPFNNLELTFQNLSSNATNYEWDFGDGNTSTVVHPNNTYADPGNYVITLIAIDDKGCRDTTQKVITILEEYYIYVPNTFTPGTDLINDYFQIYTINIDRIEMTVYDRWGEKIFTTSDKYFIWDGTYKGYKVQDGTYTYKLTYYTNTEIEGKLVGHINILSH